MRFYRPDDTGDETFYGLNLPGQTNDFTEPSAGPWLYGYWSTNSGYGFGDPRNYGLHLY
jgi:hypothetical protein